MTTVKIVWMCIVCLLFYSTVQAQTDKDLVYPTQVRQFYALYPQQYAWLTNEKELNHLFELLDSAAYFGLEARDYQYSFINKFRSGAGKFVNRQDSLRADYIFTDAAIHFFRDLMVGNSIPQISYNGLNYSPDWSLLPSMLATSLSAMRFAYFLRDIEPDAGEYVVLKKEIIHYNRMLSDTGYRKLQESASGKLSNQTIRNRRTALNRTINTFRWLDGIREANDHIIVVNIPSASLLVFSRSGVVMESKVIVGQRTRRTPTLCSKVDDVVMYPYWMVPKSIATRELLPRIKRNIGYLDANGYQVVNASGKVLNHYSINWESLSAAYFPYTLRQATGCDNSLGIVKLNFYNPFNVYLHDTPAKSLFTISKRFFSHGCVRVEKALELAKLIVKEKSSFIDSLIDKGCLPDQKPIFIHAQEKMPVFILYNTAWTDSSATVGFYDDEYRRFSAKK